MFTQEAAIYFFTNYTTTHEQVTRRAPSLEPNDTKTPYINTMKINFSMSWHSQLGKEINIRKQTMNGIS